MIHVRTELRSQFAKREFYRFGKTSYCEPPKAMQAWPTSFASGVRCTFKVTV